MPDMTAGQMREAERDAALMAVAHSLTTAERVLFLGKVARDYPRLRGADVADVLDLTTDHDMFLDRTEPFFERFADQVPGTPALIFAVHLIILMGWGLTPARVWVVLQRAGVVDPPRYPEVEVGLRAYDDRVPVQSGSIGVSAPDANHLVLKARAEQGMRAAGVPESVITGFRESVRPTGIPGYGQNMADIARWVTLVDGYTPMPRKVYDPVGDLAVVVMFAELHAQALGLADSPDGSQVATAVANLRSHLDLRSVETAKSSLAAFFGREPS